MRLSGVSVTKYFYKREEEAFRHTEIHGEGHVKIEIETGVRLPQTKELQEPPEAGRDHTRFPREPSVGVYPC